MTTTTYASASYDDKDGDSSLEEVSGSNGKQWKLNAVFDKAEIGVEVMITLGDDGSLNTIFITMEFQVRVLRNFHQYQLLLS